ncbi:MAG: YqgE/AlgH family protein [Bacteroidota bacterium]|nr:YqgE/AlgH family protein [Bacteroidota bacterium]MDP3146756.1 YqgE/AlgH family protein [Bacteroidota bacterium]
MEGNIIIAHPLLQDGFFNRSVVYITNHNSVESLGFVLNFKTQFKLSDVKPDVKNGNFAIYEGGPVAKDQLFYIHRLGENLSDSIKIKDDIYFGGNFEELMHLINQGKVKSYDIRFFAGYSGWSDGQLENEIKKNHWLINEKVESGFFGNDAEDLWGLQLTEIKNTYSIFADFGNTPSVN